MGSKEEITIKELDYSIKEIVGYNGELRFDKSKPDGIYRRKLDINKIESLNWTPKTSLNEGIKKTFEWYLNNK